MSDQEEDQKWAPTPQNTPASVSTLQTHHPLNKSEPMASISEGSGNLLDMIQNRLNVLNGTTSGYIEDLPKVVKDRVAGLKGLRVKQAAIEADFRREVLELEKKYFVKQKSFYDERRDIVMGKHNPKKEDIASGEGAFKEEQEMFEGFEEDENEEDDNEKSNSNNDDDDEANEGADLTGIPDFWLTAFRNVPTLTDLITDRDAEVLTNLVDVKLKYLEKPGFSLEFEFANNPYFSNKTLTKSYLYHEDIGLSGEYMYDHAEGTEIQWANPSANVTVRVEQRKQRNKHTKATRTIEKTIKTDSFFNFFSPPQVPDLYEELEDEYLQNLQSELDLDFELGEFLKEKLVPRAVDWFTGRALDYEGAIDGEEPEDEDYSDESGDEEEDEADSENLNVDEMKKEVPENCKQQ